MLAGDYNLSNYHYKVCLLTAIQGPTRKIVFLDYLPTSPLIMLLSNEEFVNKLQGVFLPAVSWRQQKRNLSTELNSLGRPPTMYFQDKKQIFEAAYRAGHRDYAWFRDKMVSGLINNEICLYMRQFRPVDDTDMLELHDHLVFQANVVKRNSLKESCLPTSLEPLYIHPYIVKDLAHCFNLVKHSSEGINVPVV